MKYKLLQIKSAVNCPYIFSSFDFAQQKGLSLRDYEVVYEGVIKDSNVEDALEELFMIFNTCWPADFKGHSMSVSDVVELEGVYYYCDHVGFKKITKFCS